jgi:hypothetical protein
VRTDHPDIGRALHLAKGRFKGLALDDEFDHHYLKEPESGPEICAYRRIFLPTGLS